MNDQINPDHYKLEINGVHIQCIDVIEVLKLDFHLGSALKYAWRFGRKHDRIDEEINKCLWCLDRWQAWCQPAILGGLAGKCMPLTETQMLHFELLGNLRTMCGAWKLHEDVRKKAGMLEWMNDSIAWMQELITITLDIEDAVVAHVTGGKP